MHAQRQICEPQCYQFYCPFEQTPTVLMKRSTRSSHVIWSCAMDVYRWGSSWPQMWDVCRRVTRTSLAKNTPLFCGLTWTRERKALDKKGMSVIPLAFQQILQLSTPQHPYISAGTETVSAPSVQCHVNLHQNAGYRRPIASQKTDESWLRPILAQQNACWCYFLKTFLRSIKLSSYEEAVELTSSFDTNACSYASS